ncbi:MAG: cyclic nucleotide-binding domain-containing protein [Anaerolineae bacterium]|nr:cyclic nucleotide-binding domain-containing protein [Anaerolineae bacterium]
MARGEAAAGGRWVVGLSAGLVAGILNVLNQLSYGVLLFSGLGGDTAAYAVHGIGMALFATVVTSLVIAATTALPGAVAEPQDSPAALLAIVVAAVAASIPAGTPAADRLATVVAAIALTSFLSGLGFLLLGLLKQGRLVRYIPYAVIGGFLASTGWFLFSGGLVVLLDSPPALADLPSLLTPALLARWLPGLILGVTLLWAVRRFNHPFLLPGLMLGAMLLFGGALLVTGTSISQAQAAGLLLGPLPEGGLWHPLLPGDLARVHWPAVVGQLGSILTILVVSVVSMLLNTSGIELLARRDVNLNRELRAVGLGNCLVGLGSGGPVGYHVLSSSALSFRAGAQTRLVPLISASMAGAMLLLGPSLLAYFPKMMLGGLLIFLGLDFLVTWLYDGWVRLSRPDYAVVVLILVTVAAVGVLEGVGLGLAVAVILFVVEYTRQSAVRHTRSAASCTSHVERPRIYQRLMRQRGDWLYVVELQGYLFFGTVYSLLDHVRSRLADPARQQPHFVILDFRRVSGFDGSALLSFVKLVQLAEANHFLLLFTHISPTMRRQFERELPPEGAGWRAFSDLDHGVEWCEDQRIAHLRESGVVTRTRRGLDHALAALAPDSPFARWLDSLADERPPPTPGTASGAAQERAGLVSRLQPYLVERQVAAGECLIRQGDPPRCLYFVQSGQITIQIEHDDDEGRMTRLRACGAGSLVGEVGLYLGTPASATVMVDQDARLYALDAAALARMEEEDPALAAAFHRFVAEHLSERLASTTDLVRALAE